MNKELIIIVHNIRSSHNVGSIIRTSEGLGVNKLIFSGYTPYPLEKNENRLPHLANKINKQISKTALGSQKSINWEHTDATIQYTINKLKSIGFQIVALEQNEKSINLLTYKPKEKLALILGNELDGVKDEIIQLCDEIIEIPMIGKKESLNVAQATAIAIYRLRFLP